MNWRNQNKRLILFLLRNGMEMELNGLLPFHSLISSMVSGCWLCLLGPSNSSPFPLPFPFSNNSLRLSLFAGAKKRKGKADGMEQLLKQLWNGVRLRRGLVPSHNPLFHKEKSRTNQQIKSNSTNLINLWNYLCLFFALATVIILF